MRPVGHPIHQYDDHQPVTDHDGRYRIPSLPKDVKEFKRTLKQPEVA